MIFRLQGASYLEFLSKTKFMFWCFNTIRSIITPLQSCISTLLYTKLVPNQINSHLAVSKTQNTKYERYIGYVAPKQQLYNSHASYWSPSHLQDASSSVLKPVPGPGRTPAAFWSENLSFSEVVWSRRAGEWMHTTNPDLKVMEAFPYSIKIRVHVQTLRRALSVLWILHRRVVGSCRGRNCWYCAHRTAHPLAVRVQFSHRCDADREQIATFPWGFLSNCWYLTLMVGYRNQQLWSSWLRGSTALIPGGSILLEASQTWWSGVNLIGSEFYLRNAPAWKIKETRINKT